MNDIVVENFEINNALITIDYTVNGRYVAESFPIESFEEFCVNNNLLEWYDFKKVYDGDVDEREGTWEFHAWCDEKCSDAEIKLFLQQQTES